MKYSATNAKLEWVFTGAAFLIWLAIPVTRYPTYDDGWNLHLIHNMLAGDWSQFWHHGSPLFYLFWLPWVAMGIGYDLAYVNDILGLAGLFLVLRCAVPKRTSSAVLWAMFFLIATSPLGIINRACFTVEAGGLLLLGLALREKSLRWKAIWLGMAFVYNYKLGLAAPLILGWQVFNLPVERRWVMSLRTLVYASPPFILLWAVYLLMNPLELGLRPLATYLGLITHNANPLAENPGFDWLFYVYYVSDWENVLLWVLGMVGMGIALRKKSSMSYVFLLLAWLAVGLLLPKAPRWLLPILPVLAGFALHTWRAIPTVLLRMATGLAVLGYSILRLYISPNLPIVAETGLFSIGELSIDTPQENNRTPFNQVKSLGDSIFTLNSSLPYLYSDKVLVHILRYPQDSGFVFPAGAVVWQDYTSSHIHIPDKVWMCHPSGQVARGRQLAVKTPTLWLEHAEFTGLTYKQTMDAWAQYRDRSNGNIHVHKVYKKAKP